MPVPLRTSNHRAEAKYNVTTEFPSLGLHSAAATGNVGLVEYALARGQPINSVLDGVLPLHAACAGGNEQVVKLLIEHGADVNAPRLPRRYSNEKNRDASAPIVGTSGSTPLHFAAANGNTNVVTTLLLRGAHANRSDKHGVTPEMLARQNGWLECAEVLRSWVLNKDKDLREREGKNGAGDQLSHSVGIVLGVRSYASRERLGSFGNDGEPSTSGSTSTSTRKRIQMKRSIDNAFSMLKASSTGLSEAYLKPLSSVASASTNNVNIIRTLTPPASPVKPFGEYSFYPTSPSDDGNNNPSGTSPIDPSSRRPSLPQIMSPPPGNRNRKTSGNTTASASPSPRRPRSAGTDADGESSSATFGRSANGNLSAGRKLGSKYSLMNIFKKGQAGEPSTSPNSNNLSSPERTATPTSAHQPSASTSFLHTSSYPSAASVSTSTPTSGFASTSHLPLSSSPLSQSHLSSSPNLHENATLNTPPSSGSTFSRSGFRFKKVCDAPPRASTPSSHTQSPPQPPSQPLTVDLHNALAQQQPHQHRSHTSHSHTRDRSASAGSGTRFELPVPLSFEENYGTGTSPSSSSPLARLGVLKARGMGVGHKRDRSGSGSSAGAGRNRSGAVFDDLVVLGMDASKATTGASPSTGASRPPGPGILRGHNRSTSSGLNAGNRGGSASPGVGGFRALRFDSASNAGKKRKDQGGAGVGLRGSNSAGSLVRLKARGEESPAPEKEKIPDSAPAAVVDFNHPAAHDGDEEPEDEDEDGEFSYGRPIEKPILDIGVVAEPDSQLAPIRTRDRGLSFASSSESSLSPMMSNGEDGDVEKEIVTAITGEFPFSINRPPPMLSEDPESDPVQHHHLRVPSPGDNRGRGDSMSSTSTGDSSHHPLLSASGTTSGSGGSVTVTTPLLSPGLGFDGGSRTSPRDRVGELLDEDVFVEEEEAEHAKELDTGTRLNERRSHTPLDINISSISSHAQAEALVQRAQQDILEMSHIDELQNPGSAGWTPLSARLAAYGESLALERKLREEKVAAAAAGGIPEETAGESRSAVFMRDSAGSAGVKGVEKGRRAGVERQFSLEQKSRAPRSGSKVRDPKRPHTSSGSTTAETGAVNGSFASDRANRTHQSSHSASAVESHPSTIIIDFDLESPITPQSTQPQSYLHLYPTDSDVEYNHPIVGSHIPTPDPNQGHLSRISSMDGLDTDADAGSELFRVSTAPTTTTAFPARGRRDQSRTIASATKLTRMGFSPTTDLAARQQTHPNKRFGGLKSLMQSFKGKP